MAKGYSFQMNLQDFEMDFRCFENGFLKFIWNAEMNSQMDFKQRYVMDSISQ